MSVPVIFWPSPCPGLEERVGAGSGALLGWRVSDRCVVVAGALRSRDGACDGGSAALRSYCGGAPLSVVGSWRAGAGAGAGAPGGAGGKGGGGGGGGAAAGRSSPLPPAAAGAAAPLPELEVCAICYDEMPPPDAAPDPRAPTVVKLPGCRHRFHVACLDGWMHNHSRCPICRAIAYGGEDGAGGAGGAGGGGDGFVPPPAPPPAPHAFGGSADAGAQFLRRQLEIEFMLRALAVRYPRFVNDDVMRGWRGGGGAGGGVMHAPLAGAEAFRQRDPAVVAAAQAASEARMRATGGGGGGGFAFGGGSSRGGGGRGGSW